MICCYKGYDILFGEMKFPLYIRFLECTLATLDTASFIQFCIGMERKVKHFITESF